MINKILCAVAILLVAGCGSSDIGRVTGKITIDGAPLQNASVYFYPEPTGRPSSGMTDEQGQYDLVYTRGVNGAQIGEHRVEISTAGMSGGTGGYGGDSKETVPARYNVKSDLKVAVEGGSNVHDFTLDSSGEIIQNRY